MEKESAFETPQQVTSFVESLKSDFRQADLSDRDRAMLEYSVKLTNRPQEMDRSDVDRLRDHGFDDLAIHDLVCCVSYFAFVNRIADGLGVELE